MSLALFSLAMLVIATAPAKPSQSSSVNTPDPSMLLVVRDSSDRNVIAALLLAAGQATDSRVFLLPVDTLPKANLQEALSRATGVRIDGTLVLDYVGLAAVIDAVGGVSISQQRMSGINAAHYAGFIVDDEPESARTLRSQEVFNDFFRRLPAKAAEMRALVNLLGLSARSNMPTDIVVEVLTKTSNGLAYGNNVSIFSTTGQDNAVLGKWKLNPSP